MNGSWAKPKWLKPGLKEIQLDQKVIWSLLYTTFAVCAYRYYLTPAAILALTGNELTFWIDPQFTAAVLSFAASATLLGLIPIFIIKKIFKENLAQYGIQLGNLNLAWKYIAVVLPMFVISAYPSAQMAKFRLEYPLYHAAGATPGTFVLYAFCFLFFYLGWEFVFRGFLQHSLAKRFGIIGAILVQTMASSIAHLGKPDSETFSAVLGGVIWGVMTYHTRSIFPALITHFALGVSLDFFISFG